MTPLLIRSVEAVSNIYDCQPLTCFYANTLCWTLDEKLRLHIVKYSTGSFIFRSFNGTPVLYCSDASFEYNGYGQFSESYILSREGKLIKSPEYLLRISEGFESFKIYEYSIVLVGVEDYDIHWEVETNDAGDKRILEYDAFASVHNNELYVDGLYSLIALNNQLEERWALSCESSYSTGFGRSRFFADNLLIYVSFLEEPSSLSPWPGDTVNAVCLDTGKTLWSTTFDDPVMSVMHHSASSQSEAAIYIGTDKHGIVLDAETGKQRLKFASPYNVMDMKPIFLDDGCYQGELRSESRVWTDGHFIYFTGNSGGWSHYGADQLHLYRMDGSYFSGPIQIPPAYHFDAVKQCFHLNGKSYIPVSSASQAFNLVDFGVIIIDPLTLTPESDIELEAGPVRELVHRVHDKKTESYQLQIHADESAENARDDLIRFSEIETKRIAARFGDQRWTNEDKNRKFNGQIELVITGSDKMKQDCQAMLDILVERVHLWAEESEIDAGNRKDPIKMSWQWLMD